MRKEVVKKLHVIGERAAARGKVVGIDTPLDARGNLRLLKEIGSKAFNGCSGLKDIRLSNSLTTIGAAAFENCTSLKSVSLPDSVSKLGAYAFDNCPALSKVTLSGSLTEIDQYTFNKCTSLGSIDLPDSVRSAVRFKDGSLEVFNYESIKGFIETVGNIDLEQYIKQRTPGSPQEP